jgi:hypothetical protein
MPTSLRQISLIGRPWGSPRHGSQMSCALPRHCPAGLLERRPLSPIQGADALRCATSSSRARRDRGLTSGEGGIRTPVSARDSIAGKVKKKLASHRVARRSIGYRQTPKRPQKTLVDPAEGETVSPREADRAVTAEGAGRSSGTEAARRPLGGTHCHIAATTPGLDSKFLAAPRSTTSRCPRTATRKKRDLRAPTRPLDDGEERGPRPIRECPSLRPKGRVWRALGGQRTSEGLDLRGCVGKGRKDG